MSSTQDRLKEVRGKLRQLDLEFEREMRSRGFDPAQADNIALPSHLAALYAQREELKAELAESEGELND
jgi:hypothetical protein